MDIRQFKYFVAAAEEGHLGRAAVRLHLSQPALSRQIQLLEEDVGASLFTRTPRGMVLTPIGATLLVDARNACQLFDQTLERTRRSARGELGTLDVGTFGAALFEYVPTLFARHLHTWPEVKFRLHHLPIEGLVLAMRQGRVQVVFERRLIDESDIVMRLALRERAYLALNECHPLALQESVDIMALRGEPLIGGGEPGRPRGAVEFCRENGFEPTVVREAADMTVGVALVASGVGSCIVSQSLLNLHLPAVVYRPLHARSDISFDLYCYHVRQEPAPALVLLLRTMEALQGESAR